MSTQKSTKRKSTSSTSSTSSTGFLTPSPKKQKLQPKKQKLKLLINDFNRTNRLLEQLNSRHTSLVEGNKVKWNRPELNNQFLQRDLDVIAELTQRMASIMQEIERLEGALLLDNMNYSPKEVIRQIQEFNSIFDIREYNSDEVSVWEDFMDMLDTLENLESEEESENTARRRLYTKNRQEILDLIAMSPVFDLFPVSELPNPTPQKTVDNAGINEVLQVNPNTLVDLDGEVKEVGEDPEDALLKDTTEAMESTSKVRFRL